MCVVQVATNPGVRLQTEGVFTALVSTVVVLLSVKALQPPPSAMARLISDPDLPTRYDVPALEAYYGVRSLDEEGPAMIVRLTCCTLFAAARRRGRPSCWAA